MEETKLAWKYPEAIITCEELQRNLGNNKVRVYDCTTFLHYTDDHPSKPYDVESGYQDYIKEHIPGASFLDLQNQISDTDSQYKFTLPDVESLSNSFGKLGIGDPHHIILYSTNGLQWATRVWWMIYMLGYKNVSVLNGGLKEWKRNDYDLESGENFYSETTFLNSESQSFFVGREQTLDAMSNNSCFLINALTSDIHNGESTRYGRLGRIPGSINIPFSDLMDINTHMLKSPKEALSVFEKYNISKDSEILNYCGGGIAATLNAFVLHQLGFEKLKVYDNSLSEWAMDASLPMEID
ncbi:sulfurtransferase [Paracoccaceae bacterium]|nr:sulfurtransferase [Paracoccaceae bacterium]